MCEAPHRWVNPVGARVERQKSSSLNEDLKAESRASIAGERWHCQSRWLLLSVDFRSLFNFTNGEVLSALFIREEKQWKDCRTNMTWDGMSTVQGSTALGNIVPFGCSAWFRLGKCQSAIVSVFL